MAISKLDVAKNSDRRIKQKLTAALSTDTSDNMVQRACIPSGVVLPEAV